MPKPFRFAPAGPWPQGMVNTVTPAALGVDQLVDAMNVDINPAGEIADRGGWLQAHATSDAHSIFDHNGITYGVVDGQLSRLDETGFTAIMSVSMPIHWCVLNDQPVFATRTAVYSVEGVTASLLSEAGRDAMDEDEVLEPMPGGQWVDYWNGHLLVARGHSLLFSEPLRYGAHNPLRGYIRLPERIEWVAPLGEGIFVGLRSEVVFLAGRARTELVRRVVAGESAPGMAKVIDTEAMSDVPAGEVVVFFTKRGFAVGLPDGSVAYPQGQRLKDLPLPRGKLLYDGSRVHAVRGF